MASFAVIRRILLPTILIFLAYGLWLSQSFNAIAAGVAIFLFGMLAMEEGFKSLTGGWLERILARATNRLWKSLAFGVASTTLMQSSSLVSVIAISFLGAGMINLAAGIGIIFGANLGTTTGAWLVAGFGLKVNISAFAMPMLVFGVVLVLQQVRSLRGLGYVLAGLGFIFLGIHFMKDGFDAFKSQVDLASYALPGFRGLLVYVGLGILATVIMQSSHATLVLTIAALASGQVTYDNALALAIGSNVGTTVTAIIGALGANIDGKRLAGAHLIFNLVTGVVAVLLIEPLVEVVSWLALRLGVAADDYTLQLALFHTLFNVIGITVMLPFINALVRGLNRFLREPATDTVKPQFLNDAALSLPDACVEAVRKETAHLLDNGVEIIAHGLGLHRREIISEEWLGDVVSRRNRPVELDIDGRYTRSVKPLFAALVAFISRAEVESEATNRLLNLRTASHQVVEAVKGMKHLNKNLSRYMQSDNANIRQQYDLIRIQLAKVLRVLLTVKRQADDDTMTALAFDEVKLDLRDLDDRLMHQLSEHLRTETIAPAVATSIMNDAHYALEIGLALVAAAQSLASSTNADTMDTMEDVALDAADVHALDHDAQAEER